MSVFILVIDEKRGKKYEPKPMLMNRIAGVVGSARGKDKLLKLTQYLAVILAWRARRDGRDRYLKYFERWQKSVSVGRKAGRLGNWILEVQKALVAAGKGETAQTFGRLAMALFFVTENMYYLAKIGVRKFDTETLKVISNKFRICAASIFVSVNISKVWVLQSDGAHLGAKKRKVVNSDIRARLRLVVKLLFDICVSMEKSNLWRVAIGKPLGEGILGLLGALSSTIVLWEVWISTKRSKSLHLEQAPQKV